MKGVIVVCLLLALGVRTWAATLTIPQEAAVRGEQVTLGEIATVDGTPAEQQRLAAVVVCAAPQLGKSREITPGMVNARLQFYRIPADTVTVNCPPAVTVSRLCTTVTGESLVAIGQAWLEERLSPVPGEELKLSPVRTPSDLALPDGQVNWLCSESRGATGSMRHVLVTVLVDDVRAWQGLISFRIERTALVLVAKTIIARWTPLTPDMVSLERRAIGGLYGDALRDLGAIEGQRSTVPLAAGSVLTAKCLEAIPLVKRNDQVTVRAYCGAMVISTVATACEDGLRGATIRVRNPQTRDEYTVVVTGQGEAEVAP